MARQLGGNLGAMVDQERCLDMLNQYYAHKRHYVSAFGDGNWRNVVEAWREQAEKMA